MSSACFHSRPCPVGPRFCGLKPFGPSHWHPVTTERRTFLPKHPIQISTQTAPDEHVHLGPRSLTFAFAAWGKTLLECKGIGQLAFAVPVLPGGGWSDLWRNRVFLCGLSAWFLAQFAKIFTKRYKKGIWDLMAFRDSGGMPSSHSAMSMAVTTAIALDSGFSSPLFVVALCFTSIVMYDAAGVRKHAGYQAEVLNSLVEHAGLPDTHPFSARKLKEVLGHTPRQVMVGGLLGILVGMFLPFPVSV